MIHDWDVHVAVHDSHSRFVFLVPDVLLPLGASGDVVRRFVGCMLVIALALRFAFVRVFNSSLAGSSEFARLDLCCVVSMVTWTPR